MVVGGWRDEEMQLMVVIVMVASGGGDANDIGGSGVVTRSRIALIPC